MVLQKAVPQMAYLKLGIYGEAGSGKTFTSSKVALGLHNYIKAKKPIGFADTETGSDFVLPMFREAKVELVTAKTRAFADLLTIIDESEKDCSVLIIDSITHFWNELLTAYQEKHNLNQITLRHWIPLKQTWRQFTDKFINSKIHIILAGRSAFIWDDVEDEEGVKELKKTGTKMRAETEMGYEPSLLVEMEHVRKSARIGGGWINRAWVVKDRFNVINSQHFDMPTFESFLPHIESLNLNGEHMAIDTTRNSQGMFINDRSGAAYIRKHDELVEKIKAEIHIAYPSQNSEHKTERLNLMKEVAGTRSFKEIEHMKNDMLEVVFETLQAFNAPAIVDSEIQEAVVQIENGIKEVEEGLKPKAKEKKK